MTCIRHQPLQATDRHPRDTFYVPASLYIRDLKTSVEAALRLPNIRDKVSPPCFCRAGAISFKMKERMMA
jgi:hypothetical protein